MSKLSKFFIFWQLPAAYFWLVIFFERIQDGHKHKTHFCQTELRSKVCLNPRDVISIMRKCTWETIFFQVSQWLTSSSPTFFDNRPLRVFA